MHEPVTMILKLDEDDLRDIRAAVKLRSAEDGPFKGIMPDSDSCANGAALGEIVRGWREMLDAGAAKRPPLGPFARHRYRIGDVVRVKGSGCNAVVISQSLENYHGGISLNYLVRFVSGKDVAANATTVVEVELAPLEQEGA